MTVYRLIEEEKASGFPVSVVFELLGVSRSGFHDWSTRAPSDRALTDAWLTGRIREIHQANRGVYGARRIHAELRMAQGINVGKKRVARLMRQAGISGLMSVNHSTFGAFGLEAPLDEIVSDPDSGDAGSLSCRVSWASPT